jgi:hypothetical protein
MARRRPGAMFKALGDRERARRSGEIASAATGLAGRDFCGAVVTRADADGVTVRHPDGSEDTFDADDLVRTVLIRDEALAAGWTEAAYNEWRRRDGTVMRAERVPYDMGGGGGVWGWFKRNPETGEDGVLDRVCEATAKVLEEERYLRCPDPHCRGGEHRAGWSRVRGAWVAWCPNGGVTWSNTTLAQQAVAVDSRPDLELWPSGQSARPGTRTVGWAMPSGGSRRGS